MPKIPTSIYALLSAAVYNDNRGRGNKLALPDGWKEYSGVVAPSDTSNNAFGSGFSAQAYQNGSDIVIAFEGRVMDLLHFFDRSLLEWVGLR